MTESENWKQLNNLIFWMVFPEEIYMQLDNLSLHLDTFLCCMHLSLHVEAR